MFAKWFQLWFLCTSISSAATPQAQDDGAEDFQVRCNSITSTLHIEHTNVFFSQFIATGTNLSLPENNATCGSTSQVVPADICRIALYVATSNSSGVNMEAWLPSNWTGRFLATGNGGLNGCVGYADMAYGSSLGFASVGTNNGHNGTSGGAFYNSPEVVADFAYRS
jgi:feruloyl esterase